MADRHFVKAVEPAKSDEEGYRLNQSQATGTKSTDLNDLIENVKLMDQRLLNLERKISLVIPFLRKALKDKI